MLFGTKHRHIEEVAEIIERELGIGMSREDDGETGVHYQWTEKPSDLGISYFEIRVDPVRVADTESGGIRLRNRFWSAYNFVIGVSEELTIHIARICDLIRQGVLKAEEIPEPRI